MAEGESRVNQHVLESRSGVLPERLTSAEGCPGFESAMLLRRAWSSPRLDTVVRAVEADIIPQMLLNRQQSAKPDPVAPDVSAETAGILRFAEILLENTGEAAVRAHISAFRALGHSVESVYLDLFQPAARHIGELWAADICTFLDVTLALGSLQRMMREFSSEFQKDARHYDAGRQALLVPLPGDQHSFGLSMVAEFFRRSAWNVWSAPFDSNNDLSAALRETWFTVIGFSVSCVGQLDQLASVIELARRESCNGNVGVLVGGPVFVDHPDYVTQVGADAVGLDARQAVFHAECFAAQMAGR